MARSSLPGFDRCRFSWAPWPLRLKLLSVVRLRLERGTGDYFCALRHFAHLALVAFLIFARPAAEM
jgi:hypothetical protein